MIRGFTCGSFDLLHPGHIAMLKYCKEHCDNLIVGLQTDPTIDRPETKNKPIQTTFERYFQLKYIPFVDEIIPYDTELDLENMFGILDINVRFLDESYQFISGITGRTICESRGINLHFNPRKHLYSSSELRNKLCQKQQ